MRITKSLKGIVPSAVTMTGMASGFFAILVSRRGATSTALLLVLVAILCDILDGKLARLLKASSRFGAELDSFADAISFGVAPGLILFESSLHRLGWIGGAASFFFAAMAVVRLVRFNLDGSQQERRDVFRGFSTPTAAIYLVSFIVMGDALPAEVGVFYAVALGLLMISSVPTPAFKGAGVSSVFLVFGLVNTAVLLLRPGFWSFAWWNLYNLLVLLLAYRGSSTVRGVRGEPVPT